MFSFNRWFSLKGKTRFAASFPILQRTERCCMFIPDRWAVVIAERHISFLSTIPLPTPVLSRPERAFQLSCLCIIKADTMLRYNAQTYYSTSLLSDSFLIIEFVILKVKSCPCIEKASLSSQHRRSLKAELLSNSSLLDSISLLKYCICSFYKVKCKDICKSSKHYFLGWEDWVLICKAIFLASSIMYPSTILLFCPSLKVPATSTLTPLHLRVTLRRNVMKVSFWVLYSPLNSDVSHRHFLHSILVTYHL